MYVRDDMEDQSSVRDSVAALFQQEQTSQVLSIVHRSGHGHHARLISERGPTLLMRLRRCWVSPAFQEIAGHHADSVVLIVDAPHQAGPVSELLLGLGAIRVERFLASSVTSSVLAFDTAVLGERRPRRRTRHEPVR